MLRMSKAGYRAPVWREKMESKRTQLRGLNQGKVTTVNLLTFLFKLLFPSDE